MKSFSNIKSHLFSVAMAIFLTFVGMIICYVSVEKYNQKDLKLDLSQMEKSDTQFVGSHFTLEIRPKGGDSASWIKDPILDDEGNELHGQSVGTIYEVLITNTSNAILKDWTLELVMPEFLWLNNAWNGDMEIHQTTSSELIVQTINLAEYTQTDIKLDYYEDHTGPMVSMNPGDSFIYFPNVESNEMPLISPKNSGSGKTEALIGFITYVPDQTLDYVIDFNEGVVKYHLELTVWDLPIFIVLLIFMAVWIVIFVSLIISQVRVNKLLEQQKHDAKIIEQSIGTFINFIEAKDPNTKGHSERVAKYSRMIAKEMKYSQEDCNRIYYIALMHDCGKISIPITILQKPSRLTDEEYDEIKKHTTYGARMLRDFNSIKDIDLGAKYHHERFDGKGYPDGISGDDIPMIARIICVADSFDAMNSNRCYRPRLTEEYIMRELIENKGKQFDPNVIECLIKLIENGDIVID